MAFDWKESVARRFDTRAQHYDAYSMVQRRAAQRLAEYLPFLDGQPDILEIGCGTAGFSAHLIKHYPAARFTLSDISAAMIAQARRNIGETDNIEWAVMDGENPAVEGPFDLITGNMCLQWFSDLDSGLERLRAMLKPGGQILYSMPGPKSFAAWRETLAELGYQSGMINFPHRGDVFAEDMFEVEYESALEFLRSIKKIGAHTPRSGYQQLSSRALKKACKLYDERYDGRVSWQILYGRVPA